jgi:hypothetical protein
MRIEFGIARIEQPDLLRHAIARTDLAALPRLLDRLPTGPAEAFEQLIGDVLGVNRAVEVAQDGPLGHRDIPAGPERDRYRISLSVPAVQMRFVPVPVPRPIGIASPQRIEAMPDTMTTCIWI